MKNLNLVTKNYLDTVMATSVLQKYHYFSTKRCQTESGNPYNTARLHQLLKRCYFMAGMILELKLGTCRYSMASGQIRVCSVQSSCSSTVSMAKSAEIPLAL